MAKKKLEHDPVEAARLVDTAMRQGRNLEPVVAQIEATMHGPPKPKAKPGK